MLTPLHKVDQTFLQFDRALRHAYLHEGLFRVACYDQGNRQLKLSGFALPPSLLPRSYQITVNDQPLIFQSTKIPDKALEEAIYPYYSLETNFEAMMDDIDIMNLTEAYEISAVSNNKVHHYPWYMRSWLGPSWGTLPDPKTMQRVGAAGGDIPNSLMAGASLHYKLRQLTRIYMDRDLLDLDAVLDWGCGYGRLIRFFPPDVRHKVYGADIDPINIAWGKANQPDFSWHHVPMQPPMPFEDAKFDLVYGGSVFSHLNEENQFAWLEELKRVIKTGGIAAVSVHSRHAWAANGHHNSDRVLPMIGSGFTSTNTANPDLVDVIGDFYTDSHHNYHYLYMRWGDYFEVVDILESFFGYQAMVVLRRRAT